MKILLVEDDPNKSAIISEFVSEQVEGSTIVARRSYQSGLKAALDDTFDLILLDMSLPTFDSVGTDNGNRMRAYGGRDVLDVLKRRKKPTQVAVVTQFETFGDGADAKTLQQLKAQLELDYAGNYLGTVFYQPSETAWREEMARILRTVAVGQV